MNADLYIPRRHTAFQDLQGLVIASAQCALGIHLLREAGLLAGGTTGFALLFAHAWGWSFGVALVLMNLPFFAFALRFRGALFCLKTLLCVALVSVMAEIAAPLLPMGNLHPAAAALFFGATCGVGMIGLFRHGASLGGISIIGVIAQDRWGIKAGWTQAAHDLTLFATGLWLMPLDAVLWSLLGTLVQSFVVICNHRRDWYVAH